DGVVMRNRKPLEPETRAVRVPPDAIRGGLEHSKCFEGEIMALKARKNPDTRVAVRQRHRRTRSESVRHWPPVNSLPDGEPVAGPERAAVEAAHPAHHMSGPAAQNRRHDEPAADSNVRSRTANPSSERQPRSGRRRQRRVRWNRT